MHSRNCFLVWGVHTRSGPFGNAAGIKTWSALVACKRMSSPLYEVASSKQSAQAVWSTFGVLDLCSASEVRVPPAFPLCSLSCCSASRWCARPCWLADWPARGADAAPSGAASVAAGVALGPPDIVRADEVSHACIHSVSIYETFLQVSSSLQACTP